MAVCFQYLKNKLQALNWHIDEDQFSGENTTCGTKTWYKLYYVFHHVYFQYLKNKLTALNWHVEEDKFQDNTPYGTKTFTNIIATYDPTRKKRFVLAAHYDSKNMTDGRGREFIAATDSAVPCAILLDVARQLNCLLNKAQGDRVFIHLINYFYTPNGKNFD